VTTLLAFAAVGVLAYVATPPETRKRALQLLLEAAHGLLAQAGAPPDAFRSALRQRTPRPYATVAIAAVHVAVFAAMLFGKGALGDPRTLVSWGASVGTRTTNGEWWRLFTAPFVHAGLGSLLIEVAALAQIGWTLERLAGSFAFAAAYATAAIAAGLVALAIVPLGVTYGSTAAIAALYVVLIAIAIRSSRQQTGLIIPREALTRFAPLAALFLLYIVSSDAPTFRAALAAAIAAVALALVFFGDVADRQPAPRRVAWGLGAAVALAAVAAFTLRGIGDIRPELEKLVEVERETTAAYDAALGKFRKGALNAAALTKTIEATIVPPLQAADERISGITGVPREDRHLVDDAREYIRARIESWQLRAQGLRESAQTPFTDARDAAAYRDRVSALHRSASLTLGRAERAQRTALESLHRIQGQ